MKIGNIEIKKYAALAPMAGVADRAFRELCMEYSAGYCVGEMVSAKGVSMNDRKSRELMYLSSAEHPAAIQIFGNEPEILAKAAEAAMEFNPDIIDINMGCPAPKIVKGGSGASLMKNPKLCFELVSAVKAVSDVPVTAKIRCGWDDEHKNAVEIAKLCEEAGASAITVHGRTKMQMYAPPVDLDTIALVKQNVSIPVIGNGDIVDGPSAEYMYKYTNCDLVMVGRGALGMPWVFEDIENYFTKGVPAKEKSAAYKMDVMLRHVKKLCEYRGAKVGINEARKHAVWYTKGIRNSSHFRAELSTVSDYDSLVGLSEKIIDLSEE